MAASVAFVIVPLRVYLPHYRPKGPDGAEIICHDNCPPLPGLWGIDPVAFGRGVSLPAQPVVLVMLSATWDYSRDGHDYFHDPVWQATGFAVSGIVVWFLLGRFLDDFLAWRRTSARPRFRIVDLIFAMTAAAVATITTTGAVIAFRDFQFVPFPARAWVVFWDISWAFFGYSGTTLCALQWVHKKAMARRSC
jgi:hypothetical protein